MLRLSNLYLFTYNSLQAFGWVVSLFRILISFTTAKSFNRAYASSGELICLLQKAAFLEVINGALGIVPSGVLLPLMQWGGRTHYLLAIVCQIDEVQESPAIFITLFCWSINDDLERRMIGVCSNSIEVVKSYPCANTDALEMRTSYGLWFTVWIMYQALPYIKEKDLHRDFFSIMPFSYHTFVQVVLLSYPFLWLKLYMHLLKQRRSKLGKDQRKKRE